jgi:hypothetical protein
MKKNIILSLIAITVLKSCLYAVDIGVVEVSGETQNFENDTPSYEGVFSEPEYFEKIQRLESAPAQKRITTEEAMFIPGVQGDPIKAIQSMSGVTSTNDTSGELFIYGSKPEETSTTIDHLPIGYLFHMGGLHSVVSPEAIGQIDAYLAGFDSSYGNAMGAVIDVTPQYPDKSTHGYAHLGIYDASAGINVALSDDVSMYFGVRRSYYDVALNSMGLTSGKLDEEGKTTYQEFPNYYDATLLLAYTLNSNNMFSLEVVGANDKLEIDTQENAVKDPEATGSIKGHRGFLTVGARWRADYGNYHAQTLLYNMSTSSRTDLFDGYFVDSKTSESGLYHESVYEYNNHRFVGGVEYTHTEVPIDLFVSLPPRDDNPDFDFTSAPKFRIKQDLTVDTGALFLEDIYALSEHLNLRFGGRLGYSNFQSVGSYLDPRTSLVYTLNDSSNISFSVGQYTQVPDGYKLLDEIGNSDLSYEQANHYLLHYDVAFFENSSFSFEPFYRDFKDLAIDSNATRFSNGGKGFAYGIDTSLKIREGDWYGFLAYTYLQASRQLSSEDDTLHRFYGEVPHTLQLLGSYRFAKTWAFSTLVKYHSGTPYTQVTGTYLDESNPENIRVRPIYADPFSSRLSDYFTLNVKVGQSIKLSASESIEWSFEIMNLTNHENVSELTYDDNYNVDGASKQLPLLPWFDVTYKF